MLKETLSGPNGHYSSKRVIGMMAFVLLAVAFVIDIFAKVTLDAALIEVLFWIVVGTLGITGLEKFSNFKLTRVNRTTKEEEPIVETKEKTSKPKTKKVEEPEEDPDLLPGE